MKYLLLLAIVLLVLWLLRQKSAGRTPPAHRAPPPAPPAPAAEMVACTHCGLHLPRPEAVGGQRGLYCSAAHRQEAEGG